jgi:hypothetical protein
MGLTVVFAEESAMLEVQPFAQQLGWEQPNSGVGFRRDG